MKKNHEKGSEQPNTFPSETDDVKSRRKAVGKLLAGAGVVGSVQQWGKPVIESVILPAHADATGNGPPSPPSPPGPPTPSPSPPP